MNKEELENILLEDEITQNIDKWVNKAIEVKYKDKELLALQTIIRKLQKENKKYIDIFNSTEKIMNGQERTKDKLLKENVKLQKENEDMREELQMYVDTPISKLKEENKKLKRENEELKEDNKKLNDLLMFSELDYVSKDIIRDKIKEYNKQREKAETKEINDMFVNYIDILNELLGE